MGGLRHRVLSARGLVGYTGGDLRRDLGAGLTLTALLVPAGMGYATVAGLPPETGLYASVAALVAYALVGPSRVLVLGPDSSLAPLIGAAVIPLAAGPLAAERRVALAGLLALLVGAVLVVGGALRLGFVTDLLSKPIRIGYLNGVALVVIVAQLPALLGFSVEADDLVGDARGLVRGLADGEASAPAAALGAGGLALILACRRLAPRIPGLVLAVAAGIAVTWGLDPGGVPVIGAMPKGWPSPAFDTVSWDDVASLTAPALGLSLVAFADTAVLSRAFAARSGRDIDPNHEMAALGVANLACGVAGGFPVCGSASRTPVAQAVGARTQVTGLVGAAAVALVVALAPGFTRYLPQATLAAVVIAAVLSVADVRGTLRLLRIRPSDFVLSLSAFAGVAVLGVLEGIAVAIALSLGAFVARAWRPHMAELVRITRRKGYHDRGRHPEGRRVPGLVIVRFDAPLFFANAPLFADFVRRTVEESPPPVRWVAIAAEPITDVDTTAADVLVRLDADLAARGVRLVFAELKGPVKDQLDRYGLGPRFGPERFYPTIGTAVSDYVRQTGTRWTDWTDTEPEPEPPRAAPGQA